MTDYDLNAWIAEYVMGWEYQTNPLGKGKIQQTVGDDALPHYCLDLSAVAKAEEIILRLGLDSQYAEVLAEQEKTLQGAVKSVRFALVTATARQRCEAMYTMRDYIASAKVTENK